MVRRGKLMERSRSRRRTNRSLALLSTIGASRTQGRRALSVRGGNVSGGRRAPSVRRGGRGRAQSPVPPVRAAHRSQGPSPDSPPNHPSLTILRFYGQTLESGYTDDIVRSGIWGESLVGRDHITVETKEDIRIASLLKGRFTSIPPLKISMTTPEWEALADEAFALTLDFVIYD